MAVLFGGFLGPIVPFLHSLVARVDLLVDPLLPRLQLRARGGAEVGMTMAIAPHREHDDRVAAGRCAQIAGPIPKQAIKQSFLTIFLRSVSDISTSLAS